MNKRQDGAAQARLHAELDSADGYTADARARKMLAGLGFTNEQMDRRVGDFSGGWRMRLNLAQALMCPSDLLLLDEPLGALDALPRIEMHRLIEGLWRTNGFTALLVTHDVQEAVALADRVILIEEGRIALDETIHLPRPRVHGDAGFAEIEKRILDRVLRQPEKEPAIDPNVPGPAAPGLRWAA